jgi:hypothetical protein
MTDGDREVHARIEASCDGFVAAIALGYFTAAARVGARRRLRSGKGLRGRWRR